MKLFTCLPSICFALALCCCGDARSQAFEEQANLVEPQAQPQDASDTEIESENKLEKDIRRQIRDSKSDDAEKRAKAVAELRDASAYLSTLLITIVPTVKSPDDFGRYFRLIEEIGVHAKASIKERIVETRLGYRRLVEQGLYSNTDEAAILIQSTILRGEIAMTRIQNQLQVSPAHLGGGVGEFLSHSWDVPDLSNAGTTVRLHFPVQDSLLVITIHNRKLQTTTIRYFAFDIDQADDEVLLHCVSLHQEGEKLVVSLKTDNGKLDLQNITAKYQVKGKDNKIVGFGHWVKDFEFPLNRISH